MDFEKEVSQTRRCPHGMDIDKSQAANKRGAPHSTPDKESLARSKCPTKDIAPKELLPEHVDTSTSKVEINAATVAAIRGMLREELSGHESNMFRKLDAAVSVLRDELQAERTARHALEQRISLLEQKESSASAFVVEECEMSLAVIGGSGHHA